MSSEKLSQIAKRVMLARTIEQRVEVRSNMWRTHYLQDMAHMVLVYHCAIDLLDALQIRRIGGEEAMGDDFVDVLLKRTKETLYGLSPKETKP